MKLAHAVRYCIDDLVTFMKVRTISSTSEMASADTLPSKREAR